jgi:hypothetical protein
MPEVTITGWDTRDVRFPTSLDKTGSDAMNAAGDYSAAYCILKTDSDYSGHGMVRLLPPRSPNPTNGLQRLSPLDVVTISSAKPSTMLQTELKDEPSSPSSPIGAKRGDISFPTPNYAGLVPRRALYILLSELSSMRYGISGRKH